MELYRERGKAEPLQRLNRLLKISTLVSGRVFRRAAKSFTFVIPSRSQPRLRGESVRGISVCAFFSSLCSRLLIRSFPARRKACPDTNPEFFTNLLRRDAVVLALAPHWLVAASASRTSLRNMYRNSAGASTVVTAVMKTTMA